MDPETEGVLGRRQNADYFFWPQNESSSPGLGQLGGEIAIQGALAIGEVGRMLTTTVRNTLQHSCLSAMSGPSGCVLPG